MSGFAPLPAPRFFHADAAAAGMFSRRHVSRDAHDEASARYQAESARHRTKAARRTERRAS